MIGTHCSERKNHSMSMDGNVQRCQLGSTVTQARPELQRRLNDKRTNVILITTPTFFQLNLVTFISDTLNLIEVNRTLSFLSYCQVSLGVLATQHQYNQGQIQDLIKGGPQIFLANFCQPCIVELHE